MKTCPTCHGQYGAGETFCPADGARLVTPSLMPAALSHPGDPLIGATLDGRYRILRRIGEGGMGIVYEAEHVIIEKRVALKVLRSDFSSRQDLVERFRQEAKSASKIGHSHIVNISDFGETPAGDSYFVMEMLEGEDLAQLLEREGLMHPPRAVHVVLQCCRALGAAHVKGIVHRDIKPENIFLCEQDGIRDFVKIVDFGIAKMNDLETADQPGRRLTKTGMIFGTPEYMSPEQAAGQQLDQRVDVYGLGIILYETLTGRVPFRGDNFLKVLSQHTGEPPPPLASTNPNVEVSDALERVVFRALAKSPKHRFQSMEEMAQALIETPEASEAFPLESISAVFPLTADLMPPQRSSASTLEMAATTPPPAVPASRSRAMVAAVFLLVVAGTATGLGAAGMVGFGGDHLEELDSALTEVLGTQPEAHLDPGVSLTHTRSDTPALKKASAPTASAKPSVAESPGTAETRLVPIQVRTRPAGAVVSVAGSDAGCRPSPCELVLPKGEQVTVLARRGRLAASASIVPEEPRPLLLRLQRARRAR